MRNFFLFIGLVAFFSCEQTSQSAQDRVDTPVVDSLELANQVKTLSDDKFEGRMPGTPGGEMTVDYLEEQLKAYGIEPAFEGGYRQAVPLVEIDGEINAPLSIDLSGSNMKLEPLQDFVAVSERPVDRVGIKDSPLVFCGYGIVAPEYDWNDYAGMDMKGKTAIVLVNDPGLGMEDDSLFKGNTMTYYGRWTYKYEEADRQGLDGILIIHETRMAGYPWFVVKTGWSGPQLHLSQEEMTDDCGIKGWIHLEKAKELFEAAGLDLSEMIKSARQPGFKPVALNAKATCAVDNSLRRDTSYNVVGMIKGEKVPNENIVYTAHWDHLGIGATVDGDSIYNGALDNASGTASLLGIAQAMSKSNRPARSAIFAFVTAEEQGLLGSEWYVENPVFPMEQTVANINLDAVNILGPAKDLTITGYGHSEMDDVAKRFVESRDRYIQPEQEPEKGIFFRSDHFNFAKKGVPALYAKGGYDHRELGEDYAQKFKDDYVSQHYHQPSDEFRAEAWDLRGTVEDAQLMLDIGWYLVNSNEWPKWKEGSEFKSIREGKSKSND